MATCSLVKSLWFGGQKHVTLIKQHLWANVTCSLARAVRNPNTALSNLNAHDRDQRHNYSVAENICKCLEDRTAFDTAHDTLIW